jgi:hypothetical protein
MPVAGAVGRVLISMAVMWPVLVVVSAVKMASSRHWSPTLNQMEVRTIITIVAVKKARQSVSRGARIEKKSSSRAAIREYRSPPLRLPDPPHVSRRPVRRPQK